MAVHPFKTPYDDRDAAALLAATKLHVRQTVADAAEVGATDFSGQYGGLYVRSNAANYNLDTEDTSSNDGVNVIYDSAGNHWVKAVDAQTETQRVHTAAGAVTATIDDVDIIVIKKTVGEATTVNLPSAATATKAVRIVDGKYDAATNNITIVPDGVETIMGGASYIIDSNGGSIKLTPLADGTGWI